MVPGRAPKECRQNSKINQATSAVLSVPTAMMPCLHSCHQQFGSGGGWTSMQIVPQAIPRGTNCTVQTRRSWLNKIVRYTADLEAPRLSRRTAQGPGVPRSFARRGLLENLMDERRRRAPTRFRFGTPVGGACLCPWACDYGQRLVWRPGQDFTAGLIRPIRRRLSRGRPSRLAWGVVAMRSSTLEPPLGGGTFSPWPLVNRKPTWSLAGARVAMTHSRRSREFQPHILDCPLVQWPKGPFS